MDVSTPQGAGHENHRGQRGAAMADEGLWGAALSTLTEQHSLC